MWQNYTNAFLGLCVAVAIFLGLSATAMTWTFVILGLAIFLFGLWGAFDTTEVSSSAMRHA